MPLLKRILFGSVSLLVATAIWLPCLHLLFKRDAREFYGVDALSPKAKQLAARHLQLWTEPGLREQEFRRMRASNAEWDFMGRSFLVCLQLIDEDFARDQYQRARKELGRTTLGFSYAREWPMSWDGPADIDSGPIIPVFEISAGASGMAFIGASAFHDQTFLSSLAATLDFAGFPSRKAGRLKYCASNQVGDAALLYAAVLGPLWQKVKGDAKL